MVNNLQYLPGLRLSDHVCLRFELTCYNTSSTYSKFYFDLHSANFIRMHQLLEEIDWHTNLHSLNTLEAWDFFLIHKFLSRVWRNVYLTKDPAVKNRICLWLYILKIRKRNFGWNTLLLNSTPTTKLIAKLEIHCRAWLGIYGETMKSR